VFQPRLVREHVKLEGHPQHIRFVPGTGGSYITVYHDGRTELRLLMGELLDVIQGPDDAPPPLNVRVVPVSAHSANIIVVHAAKRCVIPIVFDGVSYTDSALLPGTSSGIDLDACV
jgi:hypothetical protein